MFQRSAVTGQRRGRTRCAATAALAIAAVGVTAASANADQSTSAKADRSTYADPPATWKEHRFEHQGTVSRAAFNDTVALYFDADVNPAAANWMLPYLTKMWQYTQQTYDKNRTTKLTAGRLFSIHHENKMFGGHPSTRYDASHDYRSVGDVGGRNWINPQYDFVTQYVHFTSGAAGTGLRAQATKAFGWPAQYESQFQQAKRDFPNVRY